MDVVESSPVRESGLNGVWKKPPTGGGRRTSTDVKDDPFQFFKEERLEDAVYHVYLKKVQYHVDSDMCLDVDDQQSARLQWRLEEVRIIRCGTLQRLVAALCSETGELESTNVSVFLSTFRTFTSTKEAVDEILNRYRSVGEDVTMKQQIRETHRRSMKTVLCVWLETYPDDFYEPPSHCVLRSLQAFGETQKQDCEFVQKTSRMLREFSARDDSSDGATNRNRCLSLIFNDCEPQDLNANYCLQTPEFMSIPSETFAEQLTFVDAELFKKVVPHHCLGSVWSRRCHKYSGSNQSPSVYATVEQFNAVTYRVIATIVKQPTLPANERALVIQKWIDIAQECRQLKNFSSLKAIISGLQSAPVYRIRSVWDLVSKQHLTLFAELSSIFSEENNQKMCRELLNKEGTAKYADLTKAPKRLLPWLTVARHRRSPLPDAVGVSKAQGTVPYLGTFLTDLMMLDTALKDSVEGRLINFEKRRREFEVLTQIRLLQSAAGLYQIKYDKHFMKWFYNIRIYDDSEGYELSLEIEPEPTPTTLAIPQVKGHQKKPSLGYFSPRRLSITSSMENILDFPSVFGGGSVPLRRHRRKGSDTGSTLSVDTGSSHSPRLLHFASMNSLHSLGSELVLSPFRSEDGVVIKVYIESQENHVTNHYKSILLRNSDHTRTLLQNAFVKYNMPTARPEEYSVSQILSDKSEVRLPEKGNIFYAMNTSEAEIKCVIRKNHSKSQENRTKIKATGGLHWRRKLQL